MKILRAVAVRVALVAALAVGLPQSCPAQSLAELLGQVTSQAKASGDATLKSLGGDLATKATGLNSGLTGNPAAQGLLTSAVQSLVGGNAASSLGALSKLTEAKLTPGQMQLAKDVGHVGSAYLVQKNFAALEGSQTDVAQIVSSLRKGNTTAAIPALERVATNAKLTPPQKELVGALADKYAPGARKAGSALESGLKSLPGFGK